MRLSTQLTSWQTVILLALFQGVARSITCPDDPAAEASANPLVISACSRLSRIVSKQIATGGPAEATIVITIPPTVAFGTGSQATVTSPATTSTSSSRVPPSATGHNGGPPTHSHVSSTKRPTSRHSSATSSGTATPGGSGSPPTSSTADSRNEDYKNHVIIPVAVVCTVVPVLIIALLLWFILRRRRRKKNMSSAASESPIYGKTEKQNDRGRSEDANAAVPPFSLAAGATAAAATAGPTMPSESVQPQNTSQTYYEEKAAGGGDVDEDEAVGVAGLTVLRDAEDDSISSYGKPSMDKARGTWLETPQESQYERRGSNSWLANASPEGSPRAASPEPVARNLASRLGQDPTVSSM